MGDIWKILDSKWLTFHYSFSYYFYLKEIIEKYQNLEASDADSGWAGWALAHPEFGSSVNPTTTRGADYVHHNTASPPGFENPGASLEAEDDSKNSTTKDLRESIRELKALREKNVLSNNETEFEKTNQNSRSEVKSLRSEVKALERLNESIKNELVEAKQEVDSKNSELQDLWNTNVLSNNEIEKLKQDHKAEVIFKDKIIKALEMSKMQTEDANASTNNYYTNLFKSQNTELSKCNLDLKAEVFTKKCEITTLKERNKEIEKINHDLQEAIVSRSQDSKSEVKSLCSEITALEKLNKLTRNELMKVKQDFKAEVESKNSEIKALEISKMHIVDSNTSTINDLLLRKDELQAEVDSKNSELKRLSSNKAKTSI